MIAGFTLQPKPLYVRSSVLTRVGDGTMKRRRYHSMGGGSTGSDEVWQPAEERKKLRASTVLRSAMRKHGIHGIEGVAGEVAKRFNSAESDPMMSVSMSSDGSGGGSTWRRGGTQDGLGDDDAFEDSGLQSARKRELVSDDEDEHSNILGEHSKVWMAGAALYWYEF